MTSIYSISIKEKEIALRFDEIQRKSEFVTELLKKHFFEHVTTQEQLDTHKEQLNQLSEDYEQRTKQIQGKINLIMQRTEQIQEQKENERERAKEEKEKEREINQKKFNIFIEDCVSYGLDKEIAEMYFVDWVQSNMGVEEYLKIKKLIPEINGDSENNERLETP
jgi:chromosome segregation ATPase